jgi:hypothetical protein
MVDYSRTSIVSVLVSPHFAFFISSSTVFLMGKKKFENRSPTKFGKSTHSIHAILGKKLTSEAGLLG